MLVENGIKYYSKVEVGRLIGKSPQTIHLWHKWSNELEEQGKERLIPEPIRVGQGAKFKYRYWSEADVEKIEAFSQVVKANKGMLAEFSRRQWGDRGRELDN